MNINPVPTETNMRHSLTHSRIYSSTRTKHLVDVYVQKCFKTHKHF